MTRRRCGVLLAAAALFVLVACTGGETGDSGTTATSDPESGATAEATEEVREPVDGLTTRPIDGFEERIALLLRREFPEMDYTRRTIRLDELMSGGVGADNGIPSLQEPSFVSQEEAARWVEPQEPVIVLEVNGEARIYPIQIMMWHEVAIDELGGVPVVVTFCPLCNTAIAFDRRVDGEARRFGVSGLLRESDLVMFDYETSTLWQQLTGEAIVGVDAGKRLEFLPAHLISFADATETFPDALVLSQDTGFDRVYGQNPYTGYDRVDSTTISPTSFDDERLPPKMRVLTVEVGGESVAVTFEALQEQVVVQAEVGGVPIVGLWQPGTTSALDRPWIAEAQNIGAATAFRRELDGQVLDFEARDGQIFDVQTGSRWNVAGRALEGPLAGQSLEPVVSGNHFWFVWSVFKPDTQVIR